MSKEFTTKDVADHNTVDKGLYIIVDSNVYEMGGFVDEHPGGAKILKRVGGKDATKQFWKVRSVGIHRVRVLSDDGTNSITTNRSSRNMGND
jgi:cytochrome b involved in lipid metabolism